MTEYSLGDIAKDLLEGEMSVEPESATWDMSPGIFFVFNGAEPYPEKKRVVLFEVPDRLWEENHPAVVISGIAEIIGDLSKPPPPLPISPGGDDRVVGIILRTEGWGLDLRPLEGGKPDTKAIEEAKEYLARGGALVDHPNAIENKMYLAVGEGEVSAYSMHRHGEITDISNAAGIEGRIPMVGRQLYEALVKRYNQGL
jgi:hypothetical protein